MRARVGVAGLMVLAAAGPALADAAVGPPAARPTADGVRVVLPVSGAGLDLREAELTRADIGSGRAVLAFRGVGATPGAAAAGGLRARLAGQGTDARLVLTAAPNTMKYVRYGLAGGGRRLVVDVLRARPPVRAIRDDGCLRITGIGLTPGVVQLRGRELQPVFEHAIGLVLRGPDGRVRASTGVTARGGRFSGTLPLPAGVRGTGTVEAVVESAKDGALQCLVQSPVRLSGG